METLTIEVLNIYMPNKILQKSTQINSHFPLLTNKQITMQPLIYRCLPYNCYQLINTTNGLLDVLSQNNIFA